MQLDSFMMPRHSIHFDFPSFQTFSAPRSHQYSSTWLFQFRLRRVMWPSSHISSNPTNTGMDFKIMTQPTWRSPPYLLLWGHLALLLFFQGNKWLVSSPPSPVTILLSQLLGSLRYPLSLSATYSPLTDSTHGSSTVQASYECSSKT